MIDLTIKKFLHKKFAPKTSTVTVSKPSVTMTLPYLDDQKIVDFESKLKSLIGLYYPQIDFRVAYKTPKQIRDLFRFKDKIPKLMRSLVVYRIKCADCKACYIG